MIVRFTPEADNELAEARQWYAHQRHELDLEFMQSIDDALSRVVANPQQYPTVYRTLRRCVVRRFPFAPPRSPLLHHETSPIRSVIHARDAVSDAAFVSRLAGADFNRYGAAALSGKFAGVDRSVAD